MEAGSAGANLGQAATSSSSSSLSSSSIPAAAPEVLRCLKSSGAFDVLLKRVVAGLLAGGEHVSEPSSDHHLHLISSFHPLPNQRSNATPGQTRFWALQAREEAIEHSGSNLRRLRDQYQVADGNLQRSAQLQLSAAAGELQTRLRNLTADRARITEALFTEALPVLRPQLERRVALLLGDSDADFSLAASTHHSQNGLAGQSGSTQTEHPADDKQATLDADVRRSVKECVEQLFDAARAGTLQEVLQGGSGTVGVGSDSGAGRLQSDQEILEEKVRLKRAEIEAEELRRRERLAALEAQRVERELVRAANAQKASMITTEDNTPGAGHTRQTFKSGELVSDDDSVNPSQGTGTNDETSASKSPVPLRGTENTDEADDPTVGPDASRKRSRPAKVSTPNSSRKIDVEANGEADHSLLTGSKRRRLEAPTTARADPGVAQALLTENIARERLRPGLFVDNGPESLFRHSGVLWRSLLGRSVRVKRKRGLVVRVGEIPPTPDNNDWAWAEAVSIRCFCDDCESTPVQSFASWVEHVPAAIASVHKAIAVSQEADLHDIDGADSLHYVPLSKHWSDVLDQLSVRTFHFPLHLRRKGR